MNRGLIATIIFLSLGLCPRLDAYEISINKYSTQNKKRLCFELYEQMFKRPYDVPPVNQGVPNAYLVCGGFKDGIALNYDLHFTEFVNRLYYKSHELTVQLLNKVNLILEGHKRFVQFAKKSKRDCLQSTSSQCLILPYILKRESELLLKDYTSLLNEIFEISMSCSRDEIGKVGCFETTIDDPYLFPVKVKTIITELNLPMWKRAYTLVDYSKRKLEAQVRTISAKRGVR